MNRPWTEEELDLLFEMVEFIGDESEAVFFELAFSEAGYERTKQAFAEVQGYFENPCAELHESKDDNKSAVLRRALRWHIADVVAKRHPEWGTFHDP